MSFFDFPLMWVAGEHAHSLYYSQNVYNTASHPKKWVIIPDADHIDLYDKTDKIPFDRLEQFFKHNLK